MTRAVAEAMRAIDTGPKFLGIPERWFDAGLFRCENGHVSRATLKSEALGRDACLACRGVVWLTFPEDRETS